MKIKVKDHILITEIRPSTLQKGEVLDVSDAQHAQLLKRHPAFFAPHVEVQPQKAAPAPANKMAPAPLNKAAVSGQGYEKSTVVELKAMADGRKVDISQCRNKWELIGALQAADAAAAKPDYAALSDEDLSAQATERGIDLASLGTREDVIAALQLADEEAATKPVEGAE